MDRCPYCDGDNLKYVVEYEQWYCLDCASYMPKGWAFVPGSDPSTGPNKWVPKDDSKVSLAPKPGPVCPESTNPDEHRGDFVYIPRYDQFYCLKCNHFMPIGWKPTTGTGGDPVNDPAGGNGTDTGSSTDTTSG